MDIYSEYSGEPWGAPCCEVTKCPLDEVWGQYCEEGLKVQSGGCVLQVTGVGGLGQGGRSEMYKKWTDAGYFGDWMWEVGK